MKSAWALGAVALLAGCDAGHPRTPVDQDDLSLEPDYVSVVERVSQMVENVDLQAAVARRGLSLVDVTWEDTGRAPGSVIGPNISDFTLQVRHREAHFEPTLEWYIGSLQHQQPVSWQETLMPVIRHPNFSDRTGDVPADRFFVRVGNARGHDLVSVALTDVIRDLGRYSSVPSSLSDSGEEAKVDLSAERDTHFPEVSAQALFLPITRICVGRPSSTRCSSTTSRRRDRPPCWPFSRRAKAPA